MAPKRKAIAKSTAKDTATKDALAPPDRNTWPGWVEMESEPAFFNVMLQEMGVRGVKIQEVWDLDDEMLAFLPKPVHALIFLFRYQETDQDDLETECPDHIWYAEQVPQNSCASVALLNIVNNIPGLELGKDLSGFKNFTEDMTPRHKGDAIDDFTFVKRIHNSFAREADLLEADVAYKEKQAKERKRQAVAKAQKTKAANAARKANAVQTIEAPKGTRTSARSRRSTVKSKESATPTLTPPRSARSSSRKQSVTAESESTNGKTTPSKKPQDTATPSSATKKLGDSSKKSKSPVTAKSANADEADTPSKKSKSPVTANSNNADDVSTPSKKSKSSASTPTKPNGISPESDVKPSEPVETPKASTCKKLKLNPPKNKVNLDDDYKSGDVEAKPSEQPRRSTRTPKPRQTKAKAAVEIEDTKEGNDEEEAFHFCAYMPIGERVWKLDGMDQFPQDMGPVEEGEDWLGVMQPALLSRMAQYAAGSIEFNIMAVVHDPMLACVESLAANVKTLQAVEEKLDGVVEDWREMTEENDSMITGEDAQLKLQNVDIVRAGIHKRDSQKLSEAEDLEQLLTLRDEIVLQQSGLRAACRDEIDAAKSDYKKARMRRHDFSTFAKEWIGALAEQEVLEALIDSEE